MPLTEAQARQNLRALLDDFHKLTPEQRAEMTEASVVRQFIDRLLEEVLGWPIKDPDRYKYELHTQVGRPDLTLFPESGGVIFVEAKKFGVIKPLKTEARSIGTKTLTPSQMALAGMAADRTAEEQQAINYAFANGGTWAILTNFEKLRLFNARRDWLVLSFDEAFDYLHDFDLLWQLAYHNVTRGSLDILSNQRHARDIDSQYLDFINEWRERLAQDVVQRRDQNPWAFNEEGRINLAALRAVVQRFLDRLVVIRFAEDHLVIPPGTLRQFYELRKNNPYTHSMDEMLDTFFRRFDENHNSALFAPDLTDQASFSDDALLPLVEKLYEVRYRALPADILGNTYEQYLGKTLALDDGSVKTRDNLETRKKQGSYYTPQVIVRYIVDNSLGRYLYGTENGQPDGKPIQSPPPGPLPDSQGGGAKSPPYEVGRGFRGGDKPQALGVGMSLPHTRATRDLWAQIKPLAREMRKEPTLAEKTLWGRLRGKQVGDVRFRRQHPIDKFIVDFYCAEARLVVEVDGPVHDQQADYDALRQEFIESLGIRVIRFTNDEVLQYTDGVVERIGEVVGEQLDNPHPPAPSPILREGEESPLLAQRGGDLGVGTDSPQDLGVGRKTARDIINLRVLDSACGSGSFLIYAYQVLARFYESEIERLTLERDARVQAMAQHFEAISLDERVEIQRIENEIARLRDYPHLILETHLYGIDLDPQAAEIATVNLIMRAMEGRHNQKLLPLILNQNVKVGNSLVGLRPDDSRMREHAAALARICQLRAELLTLAHGTGAIDDLEREAQALRDKLNAELADHFTDLNRVRPFHWGVEFPEAFYDENGQLLDNPGFTIIFGNPPWEIVKPDLREFYAQFDPAIEHNLNRAQAETRIAELNAEDPRRPVLYEAQKQYIEQTAAYVRASPDYSRQGSGDTATHKLFIERMWTLLQDEGRLGYVVPSGIYTDLGTKELREMLLNDGQIDSLVSLTNGIIGGDAYFPDIHRSFKIVMLAVGKGRSGSEVRAVFRIDPYSVPKPDEFQDFVANPENFVMIRRDLVARFNPDSLGIMEFQSQKDYETAEKIYLDRPLLRDELADSWNVKFTREFDITNDRHLFNTQGNGLPLYEGKTIYQYDAFFEKPQYWLIETPAVERLARRYNASPDQLDYRKPRLAYRGIARSTDHRTLMVAILPPHVFSEGRSATTVVQHGITIAQQLFLAGCMNSFVLDWILRLKVAANVNMFHIYSLPIPRLTPGNPYFDAIVPRAARLTCTRPEFADLWREVMGSTPPPYEVGRGSGGGDDRQRLRNEIDALVAHLYGLTRDEFDHILGTFPLVFPDSDEGRARRAALLAVYDATARFDV